MNKKKSISSKHPHGLMRHPVLALMSLPGYWPMGFFEWLVAWTYTRRWKAILGGCVVLVVFCYLGILSRSGMLITPASISSRYMELASKAEQVDDAKTLNILYRRLLATSLEPSKRFKMASFLGKHGKADQARQAMRSLAPDDGKGYGPAHLWMVQDLVERSDHSTVNQERIRHHAYEAQAALPNDPSANIYLAQVLVNDGNSQGAVALLEKAAETQQDVSLPLSQLLMQLGNKDRSEWHLKRATEHFQTALNNDPRDQSLRTSLVQAFTFGGRFDEAVKIAEEAARLMPDKVSLSRLQEVYLVKFDSLSQLQPTEAAPWLAKVLGLNEFNPEAMHRAASLLSRDPVGRWPNLEKRIATARAQGKLPAKAIVLLSEGYIRRGDNEKAIELLLEAIRIDPTDLKALNNAAWLLAHRNPPDYPQANRLIDQAIQVAPQELEIRATQGVILLRQGQTTQAIATLEPLLGLAPGRADIRESLADAYEKIGDARVAAQHRATANQLKGSTSKQP